MQAESDLCRIETPHGTISEIPLPDFFVDILRINEHEKPGDYSVTEILDDLERNLTYLYRNPEGMVAWAYPVTVDQTPHALTFSTGERLFAA